ncbi:MAG: bifunctional diaminohydroxyphosphoribosylaminopyrimidine deaminase/5-amino-6-(5-phosphoribosylamino)uracil reductase RibD [Burkholderiaceae bacterium]|jgi:diaminohydroxyphosphoribosylaminopyrimidine deaminase/5-amino-6-(5-phosphoribosylamino)uracil reductase|nr:bifunctional diaminohydroxyphosphoribosylaminopyrimidine deaminase/5-amino-6-(5-phosphoribosylamino)uracil reductase RibD [Burkholderiaceae bacterium]
MFTPADHDFMQRALQLAELGLFTATPNPRVGCVVVRDNAIVGEGWHRRAGEPHAEVLALAQAGERARGGTAYVTLEPCNHHGRTPPCVDALIEARVGRVIAAMEDPNPSVNGAGLERLRAAGIDVRCGLLQQEARDLNIGFVSRMARGRPWVRLKVATSLDGRTALPDGRSQWITGEAARADAHAWRARACAILTGIGTVRDDNPQLTVRHVQTSRQPLRVLVDSRFEVNPAARILEGGSTLVACAVDAAKRVAKTAALEELGCEVITLPDPNGKVDLAGLLLELARRGINELHVEAGYRLNGSLLREECVDELLVYMAPTLLGNSMGLADLAPPEALEKRLVLHWQSVERVGDDLRLLARLPERI